MLRPCLLAIAILWLGVVTATAGAWPREQGGVFASATVRLSWPQDMVKARSFEPTGGYRTLYLEYGLTNRLTVGLDLGRSVSGRRKTVVFGRIPIRNRDTGIKAAFQLGLGTIDDRQIIRPGISLGWGLENGWIAADAVAEMRVESGEADLKLDVTWGRNLGKGRKLILQMQMGDPVDDPSFARFAPSIVFPLNDMISLETGAAWGIVGDNTFGLKVGLWTQF